MNKQETIVQVEQIHRPREKREKSWPPKLWYGFRIRVDQLKYLKNVQNPSEWMRKAIDEKLDREQQKDLEELRRI